jgi:protein SCO1
MRAIPGRETTAQLNMKFLTTLFALLIISIASSQSVATSTNLVSKPSCCAKVEAANPQLENSLYQLDSSWTNDLGETMELTALEGRPQVVTMFFSKCSFACPILINDMKRIEEALPENVRTNTGFTLITFDTERDTPTVLAQYRASHDLAANWTLLRGGSDDVLEIAALLGIKYKKDARGDFAHSNVISLLDKKGEILLQQVGLNRDPDSISSAIAKLVQANDHGERDDPAHAK